MDLAIIGSRLVSGIRHHLGEESSKIKIGHLVLGPAGLETFQEEQLADELVEPRRLAFDAVEGFGCSFTCLGPCQLEGHHEPCKRRAQLVRNVSQQPLLRTNQCFNALGHGVEVTSQLTDLIATASHRAPHPRTEIATTQFSRRASQRGHRRAEISGEPKTQTTDHYHQNG